VLFADILHVIWFASLAYFGKNMVPYDIILYYLFVWTLRLFPTATTINILSKIFEIDYMNPFPYSLLVFFPSPGNLEVLPLGCMSFQSNCMTKEKVGLPKSANWPSRLNCMAISLS